MHIHVSGHNRAVQAEDRHWTMKELVKHSGIYASIVPHILQQDFKMHSFAARYHVHHVTHYEPCCINLEQFCRTGGSMLNQVTVTDETWARACGPELKEQSCK